jgi:uncharacterized protein involved in tolerance to divalent cations
MVFIRVSSNDEQQLRDIAGLLLKEHLVMDVDMRTDIDRMTLSPHGELRSHKTCLLTAKTKGLLFNDIDKLIRAHYPDTLPEVYSLPIVYMDWDQADLLTREVKQV